MGFDGQNRWILSRAKMAGTSVRAATAMRSTPTIRPGASVRRLPRLDSRRAANAAATVPAAAAITSPMTVRASLRPFSVRSPLFLTRRSR